MGKDGGMWCMFSSCIASYVPYPTVSLCAKNDAFGLPQRCSLLATLIPYPWALDSSMCSSSA